VLSEDSQARLERNPLRILDSKAHQDWPVVDSAPTIDEFLTDEAADFFGKVTAGLNAAGIKWERAPRLVRGLDYYRHTAFEFITDQLGAQGTVLAGGRYDGLIEALGGPHTPAVGWAAGIERLAMMIEAPAPERPDIVVIPMDASMEGRAFALAQALRGGGFAVEMSYRGNVKKRLSRANSVDADLAIFVGPDEFRDKAVSILELKSRRQTMAPAENLTRRLEELLRGKFLVQSQVIGADGRRADYRIFDIFGVSK
jgi:histidyl-tRNA synthetase